MIQDDLYISNSEKLLKEYRLYLLVVKMYSKSTLSIYYNNIDSFMYFLQTYKYRHISQIDKNTFQKYIIYVRSTSVLSNRTTNMIIASLNNFTIFLCKKYKVCKINKIRQLKFISKIPNILDEEDMLELLKKKNPAYNKTATWVNYRDYALVILIYSSGIRIGEAVNITPLCINTNDRWIRIDNAKNQKTRIVPINIHVLIAINNYKELCPYFIYEFMWFDKKGNKLKSNSATVAIKKMFGYSAHYFRHAFATHLVLNGGDLMIIKEFLGHSYINTTSVYLHIKPKHLLAAVQFHPLAKI